MSPSVITTVDSKPVSLHAIKQALWNGASEERVWAVLDGARIPRLHQALLYAPNPSLCLFAGTLSPQLQAAAPYLVALNPSDSFTDRLLELAWGNAGGIFIRSQASMDTLYRHLKTFLRVRDEEGNFLLFRYYDPRVLQVYLPTCTSSELAQVFGSEANMFLLESANGNAMLVYRMQDDELVTEHVDVTLQAEENKTFD